MYDVHVSGHACQEEQKLMLTLTRPKYFLPVHGEYKQLKKHAITAASLGIPTSNILIAENGSNIILSQDEMKLGEPVTAGAVMVDGLGVGDVATSSCGTASICLRTASSSSWPPWTARPAKFWPAPTS